MAARGRWRVEVLPLFTRDDAPPLPPPASPALQGPPPRLTELAVACDLSGAALDEELANVRRHRSELAAYEAGLVERKAALGAAHHQQVLPGARTDVRADADVADPSLESADDFLPDEVAALLGMSVPSARYLVEHDLVLVRQLPEVWHALADGRIDETRAAVIVRGLRWQGASHGGPVDDDVLAGVVSLGVGWAERGCPPSTLKKRLDAALIAAEPAAADRRAELRKRAADVRVTGTGDGLADLRAEQMDIADAKLVRAQLDAYAYAHRLRADGDERPLGALRVAVLTALVTRPWEKQEPVAAHLTIDADLADLGPLPDLTSLVPFDNSPFDSPPDDDPPDSAHPDEATTNPDLPDSCRSDAGSGVGHVDGLPVGPVAVRALLQRVDALGLTDPDGGELVFAIGARGRLLAVATPDELVAAARAGVGTGPPPAVPRYRPSAAQYRYLRARDRHCRFPGCRQVARACDADHVVPYDHARPSAGGPTCTTNLVMLCRRHHRLKTHASGWSFRLDADGTLHLTTPGGATRVTCPPALDQVLDLVHPPTAARPGRGPAALLTSPRRQEAVAEPGAYRRARYDTTSHRPGPYVAAVRHAARVGAAQDTYRTMLRDQVAPTLRQQGWKGSAGRFTLPDPTHHLLVGFQGSTSSDSVTVSFTVNLATIDKAAWEARREGWWGKPSASTHGLIGVHHRLGSLMPQAEDTWWDVPAGGDTRPLADLVCSAITQYGVPALLADRSLPQASTPWLELARIAQGETPG